MKYLKWIMAVTTVAILASCTTRNTTFENSVSSDVSQSWHVHGIEVTVPDSLTTTEINLFQPDVDIVWHGDWPGDRKKQVAVILKDAVRSGAEVLIPENNHRAVDIEVTLIRFHSLTPRARSWTGGVHKVSFAIQVVDEKTGEVLAGPSILEADEFAYGGHEAVRAEIEGQTMKVRIINRISEVVASWLGLVSEGEEVSPGSIFSIGH